MIKQLNAGVLFIDLLGISVLTQNHIDLKDEIITSDLFKTYALDLKIEEDIDKVIEIYGKNEIIASWLLINFRNAIKNVIRKYDINVELFSDCAYIWSCNSKNLIMATVDLMWQLTFKGILCRGGLSYGSITIEGDNNKKRLLLGDAITKAFNSESSLGTKGCRIFTDISFIEEAYEQTDSYWLKNIYNYIFQPVMNPITYCEYDEFKWYVFPDLLQLSKHNYYLTSNQDRYKILSTLIRTELIIRIICSEKYLWNTLNNNGKIQLSASALAIANSIKDFIPDYEHLQRYDSENVINWFNRDNCNNEFMIKLYLSYCCETLNCTSLSDKEKKKLLVISTKHFHNSLKDNCFINKNIWRDKL